MDYKHVLISMFTSVHVNRVGQEPNINKKYINGI
jgi:hypothetical protein